MLDGGTYLDYEPGHPAPTALACAVCFIATCGLDERQCAELFGLSKGTMISAYEQETEAVLRRADFIISNDLTVLQAFVLSLVCSQSQ